MHSNRTTKREERKRKKNSVPTTKPPTQTNLAAQSVTPARSPTQPSQAAQSVTSLAPDNKATPSVLTAQPDKLKLSVAYRRKPQVCQQLGLQLSQAKPCSQEFHQLGPR